MNELPLRDIHLPDAVSWWPLAIGWWLLAIAFLASALVAYYLIKRRKNRKRNPAYKKIALAELNVIKSTLDAQSIEQLRAISTLLRRIALSYLPRESVASLTGEQWINQLNKLSQETFFSNELSNLLANAPYKAQAKFNSEELTNICERWIKQLPDQTNKEVYT